MGMKPSRRINARSSSRRPFTILIGTRTAPSERHLYDRFQSNNSPTAPNQPVPERPEVRNRPWKIKRIRIKPLIHSPLPLHEERACPAPCGVLTPSTPNRPHETL